MAFFLSFSLIGSVFMIAQMFQTGLGYLVDDDDIVILQARLHYK